MCAQARSASGFNNSFADVLRRSRLAAGLTQEQLADRAGITRNFVGLLESGRRGPSLESFIEICRALEIEPAVFLASMDGSGRASSRRGMG